MTYGVFTFVLGLVIFLVSKLMRGKNKIPSSGEEIQPVRENKPAASNISETSPDNLVQWTLNLEKAKTELKEKLCSLPESSHSKVLFGQEDLLMQIFNVINKEKSVIELCGRSGIGKTALALNIAKRHQYNHQNIKLYLDLGGETEGALSIRDAMIQVVLSFRPTTRIPDNLTQLKKLYQNMMASRQGIFILDNIASAKQVKDMKPSGSWLVIVTGLKTLRLTNAVSFNMEPLEIEPAQEFLIDCSLRLKPRAREIAKLCRSLPLTIQMVGNFLSSNMKVHPEDFIQLFRKYQKNSLLEENDMHEESLTAAFKAIYNSLGDKEKLVFNQLEVFPSSFDAKASAYVCEENGNCLKSLAQFGLVIINSVSKRYTLDPWIKNQLKNYLPDTLAREARLRHANYYLPILKSAHENVIKGGEKAQLGYQVFHREWPNINAGFNRMHKNSVEGKKAAEIFNSYILSGVNLFPHRYFPRDWLKFMETGLKVSQRLQMKTSEATHLLNLGAFNVTKKKYVAAKEYLERANQLIATLEDYPTQAKIYNEMAKLHLAQNKNEDAIDILLQKKELCLKHQFEVDEDISLMRLGLAYEQTGEFDKAVPKMKEGVRKAKDAKNGLCIATLLKHIGYCQGRLNNLSRSEKYLEASLTLARGLNNRSDELEIILQLGEIYVLSEEPEQALKRVGEGLELAEQYRDTKYEGLLLTQMGDIYLVLHEKQKAIECYQKALAPLKKAKELTLVEQTKQKQSIAMKGDDIKPTPIAKVIRPVKKINQGKGLLLAQNKTLEFIQRGDNKLISYYIGSIDEIVKTYNMDIQETTTRKSLSELMGDLRANNHHACATLLKNKFSL